SCCDAARYPSLDAPSDHLRRQRNDLHEPLLTQLPPDRAEDARRTRVAGIVDDDRRVVVEADVGPVPAAHLLRRTDDDRLGDVALLQRPVRKRLLDGDDHDIAHPGVTPARTAEYT